ncbi:PAS domain-containing sensor histidine kinase [Quatrionicoccus australiensis]|uniref:PAS domain-containing sensor histidine kinase n=1 Tax=Quatrionicoccus australiensis TaxID=138118 RepID=UPI001CFBF971|nr:ATP-binding protein [Quatrionicoccus australiensis]MCB4358688.1 PAS domain-containing protein [Quatrionicoccus australiensis]
MPDQHPDSSQKTDHVSATSLGVSAGMLNNTPVPCTDILDTNPVPCFVIDAQHRVIQWNKGCEQLLGISAAEMLGTSNHWQAFYPSRRSTLADLIVDERVEALADELYRDKNLRRSAIIADAYEAEAFFPQMTPEGRHFFFTAAPLRSPDGKIIGAVETLQDVSAQRRAEQALQDSHDRLEQEVALRTAELLESNRQLAISLHRAEEASQLKSAFLEMLTLELKTPLNGIIGIAELIRKDPNAAENIEYAAIIHESGSRLFKLLDDMLNLTEIKAGEAKVIASPSCTRELIESLVRENAPNAEKKGIALNLQFARNSPEIVCNDPRRMTRSLAPLIENAIRFTQEGEVTIDVEREHNEIVICVSDTGPGVPPDARENIFEIFRQGQLQQQFQGGLGLGLALARAEAELLGGSLILDPQQGTTGARFILRLPI